MKIAFIGLGNMGSGMARRLIQAGHGVTVYNRSAEKAADLVREGARLAKTPAESTVGAELLITMLSDDAALRSVLEGDRGALRGLERGSAHASMSTVGVPLVEELEASHRALGIELVGAPVFGRPSSAAQGKLVILAAGGSAALRSCEPAFAAMAAKVIVVGERPAQANLCKILGNFMLISSVELLAETMALAGKSGLDPAKYLEAMTGSLFTAPFYQNYGSLIAQKNYKVPKGFGLALAAKDIGLAASEANRLGAALPLAEALRQRLSAAEKRELSELDLSALGKLAAIEAGLE